MILKAVREMRIYEKKKVLLLWLSVCLQQQELRRVFMG